MFCIVGPAPAAVAVASPDGQVQFRLLVSAAGRLEYAVTLKAKPVIEASPLGITIDGVNLAEGVRLGRPARYKVAETYPWYGVHSTAVNRCNSVRIPVTHAATRTAYILEARAYYDGIAFRHVVPGGARPSTPDEATLFRIPAGSTVWYHDFEGHYEGIHKKKDIREVASGEWVAPPLTSKLPAGAGYAPTTEGALVRYAGLALRGDGRGGFNAK